MRQFHLYIANRQQKQKFRNFSKQTRFNSKNTQHIHTLQVYHRFASARLANKYQANAFATSEPFICMQMWRDAYQQLESWSL